jgi:hypothetical protein
VHGNESSEFHKKAGNFLYDLKFSQHWLFFDPEDGGDIFFGNIG